MRKVVARFSLISALARLGLACFGLAPVAVFAPLAAQESPSRPVLLLPPLPDAQVQVAPRESGSAKPASAVTPVSHTASAVPVEARQPVAAAPAAPPTQPQVAPPLASEAPGSAPGSVPPPTPGIASTGDDIAAQLRPALEAIAGEPAGRNGQARKVVREQILAVYAARGFRPLWIGEDGNFTAAAKAALTRLARASEDALSLAETQAPAQAGASVAAKAAAEVALSQAVVAYGQQASGSRINPRAISALITEKPDVATPEAILRNVAQASDADSALRAFNPSRVGYAALRTKLAEARHQKPVEVVQIAQGPTLKVGMRDVRVPALRARFDTTPIPDAEASIYDARIAAGVAEFQRGKGLPPSGNLTQATVAALALGNPARVEDEIIANMERWRWLPRQEASDRIEVNIPDYTVRVTRGGVLVHSARVVVGKPDTPTPIFSNRMQFLEVNPYWNVPQSIIKNEMLPRLAHDPNYLARMGYEVKTNRRGEMTVRQPPGERNALGNIKFMFPNEHAVYLHDTPSRGLFASTRRAFSHGCVRVDQPFRFAEIVMGKNSGWDEQRVKRLIGKGNRTIQLPQHIDVHLEYFTAFVDEAGTLQLREDIYGYSRKVKSALGLIG